MSGVGQAGLPSAADFDAALHHVATLKFGDGPDQAARLERQMGCRSPDLYYEAMVASLVDAGTAWLDIGCGWSPFPFNPAAARALAARCRLLVGIDPGPNLAANGLVHQRVPVAVEDYHPGRRFDLVTMRMVAEHLATPDAAMAAIARLLRPGGKAVIYTVDAYSPTVVVNRLLPRRVRAAVVRGLGGAVRDLFPAYYRLNRRGVLRATAAAQGLDEIWFRRIDDCRASQRWPRVQAIEWRLRRKLRACGLRYPEACLLAVFRRAGDDAGGPG